MSFWEKLLALAQSIFTLARDLEETRAETKHLREEVNKLTSAVILLKGQIDVISQREEGERGKLALKLETEFLKRDVAAKSLPSARSARAKKEGAKK